MEKMERLTKNQKELSANFANDVENLKRDEHKLLRQLIDITKSVIEKHNKLVN